MIKQCMVCNSLVLQHSSYLWRLILILARLHGAFCILKGMPVPRSIVDYLRILTEHSQKCKICLKVLIC